MPPEIGQLENATAVERSEMQSLSNLLLKLIMKIVKMK